ncbi:GIY-YIG nuclease family protein [Flavitalea sp.]
MYFIYIPYSPLADKYYIGYSDDPHRRLLEHNSKPFNTFTSKYRPWELRAIFECGTDKATAMKTEKFIKKQKSRTLIEQLIVGKILHSSLVHLVRIPHLRD